MASADQGADVLEDGHGLLAVDDVLDGGFLSILTGDDIAGDILVSAEDIGDGAGGAVIRGEDEDVALVGSCSGGQVGFSQVLGDVELPVGGHLADDLAHLVAGQGGLVLQGNRFAGVLDDEGAIGDLGLQDIPGAFEEQEGVVVGGSAGIQVQRVAGAGGLVDQVLSLGFAHRNAVEGDVVVDGIGVADQAVIGDDLDAGSPGFFSSSGSSGAVLRADDEDFDALGDQGFNVGFFLGGVTLAEEDLDVVTGAW